MNILVNIFSFCLWLLTFGLLKKYPRKINRNNLTFSIIIACRNEEKKLKTLFTGLKNQNYLTENYEIIIVNDASEDSSLQLLHQFENEQPNVTILNISPKEKKHSGKMQALALALKKAKNEILLYTDADTFLPQNWISSYAELFAENVDGVVGAVYEKNVNSFQHFVRIVANSIYATTIGLNKPFSCSGANFAVRREAVESVGGYEKIKHNQAGDDKLMLNLLVRNGYRFVYNFDGKVFGETEPERRYRQQKRRFGKFRQSGRIYQILNLAFFALLLYLPYKMTKNKSLKSFLKIYFSGLIYINVFKFRDDEKLHFSDMIYILIYPYYLMYFSVLGNVFGWKWKE